MRRGDLTRGRALSTRGQYFTRLSRFPLGLDPFACLNTTHDHIRLSWAVSVFGWRGPPRLCIILLPYSAFWS